MKVNNNYSVGFYEYSEPDEEGNISFKVVRSSLTFEEAKNFVENNKKKTSGVGEEELFIKKGKKIIL